MSTPHNPAPGPSPDPLESGPVTLAAGHRLCDFDALACLVAATVLYPGARGVLPAKLRPNVRNYLAVHGNLYRVLPRSMLDLDLVQRLVAVDAANWGRLDGVEALRGREGLAVHVWDHHPGGTDLGPAFIRQEPMGAAVTLLLEEIRSRDLAISPMQATLFLLGLYEDTGSLSFPSTTARDAQAAAFLLENGAELNVAAAYLSDSLDEEHVDFFGRMVAAMEMDEVAGVRVGLVAMEAAAHLNLAPLVGKARTLKGVDAAFGFFGMEDGPVLVIGRDGSDSLDVGAAVRELGGGGHPGAGSALVRGRTLAQAREEALELLARTAAHPVLVRDIMSRPEEYVIGPEASMDQALERLPQLAGRVLLVMDGDRLAGLVGQAECAKVRSDSQRRTRVSGFMRRSFPVAAPGQVARQALRLMAETGIEALPVLDDQRLAGLVTRGDAVLHLY